MRRGSLETGFLFLFFILHSMGRNAACLLPGKGNGMHVRMAMFVPLETFILLLIRMILDRGISSVSNPTQYPLWLT